MRQTRINDIPTTTSLLTIGVLALARLVIPWRPLQHRGLMTAAAGFAIRLVVLVRCDPCGLFFRLWGRLWMLRETMGRRTEPVTAGSRLVRRRFMIATRGPRIRRHLRL